MVLSVKVGVADLGGARSAADLAAVVGAHPQSLHRVLRALAAEGMFAEQPDGRFLLTPLSELLCSGAGGSMRDIARLYGEPWLWRAYGKMLHSVRSGEAAFERVHG